MSSIGKIISFLESIEKDLKICMRCGMCQSVCPLYKETRLETDVARGKLAILYGFKKAFFEKPNGVAERLNRCLLCGSCQVQCPSSVKSMEVFLKARAVLFEYSKLSRLKKFILRRILSVPDRFHKTLDLLAMIQKFALNKADPVAGTLHTGIQLPLISKRHIVPLARAPFHERPFLPPVSSNASIKVAVFTGCLIDRVFPSIAESTLKVLGKLRAKIFLPEDQACCGIPALSHGDLSAFKTLIRKNVELFTRKECDLLITACSTCAMTVKDLWPTMIDGEDTDFIKKVYAISSKVLDVTAFIARYGQIEQSSNNVEQSNRLKVTYHDPCHLKKSLGIWKEPRKILRSLGGYQFIEMVEADSCCGFGGSFGLEHEDISTKIGLSKIQHFVESGADIIATACPACMLQFYDLLSRMKIAKPVKHVVELYADAQTL